MLIGTNYCVDESTLAEVNSIDADGIERDHPDVAARFAGHHDGGNYPGYWKDLIGQIVDNNRVDPSWTVADLGRVRCPTLLSPARTIRSPTRNRCSR